MKIKRVEHIAIAVNSLKQSIDLLRDTFGLPLEYEEQIGQTRLAMLPVGQSYIELLEGQGPESGVTKWISEKGTGLFHICFEVEDIDGALAELKAKGVKLRDETPRIGHGGARIAFIDPSSTGDVHDARERLPMRGLEVCAERVGHRDERSLGELLVRDPEDRGDLTLIPQAHCGQGRAEAAGARGQHEAPDGRQDRAPRPGLRARRLPVDPPHEARDEKDRRPLEVVGQVLG